MVRWHFCRLNFHSRSFTREHFVALVAMILAHGYKMRLVFRAFLRNQSAHTKHNCLRNWISLIAESFISYNQQLFTCDVPNHIDRRTLRCLSAVIVLLSVVALAFDIRLRVYMPCQMHRHIRREIFKIKAKTQSADGTMPCFKHIPFPLLVRCALWLEANCNQRTPFHFIPIILCRPFGKSNLDITYRQLYHLSLQDKCLTRTAPKTRISPRVSATKCTLWEIR